MLIKSLIINKTKTSLINTSVKFQVHKRFMFKGVSHLMSKPCQIVPPTPFKHIITRNLPGQGYTMIKPKNKIIGKDPITGHNIYESDVKTSTGQELPLHENSHVIVRDNETGKDVGVLTSAKNPAKGNINIAPENYKGEKLPYGQPKPQQFRGFDSPRYSKDATNMQVDIQATTFGKKYEPQLDQAVKKVNTYKKPALLRVDKDSPTLYHQDGRPLYDSQGKEINYDD